MLNRRRFIAALGAGAAAAGGSASGANSAGAGVKVGVITDSDGAHIDLYYAALAETPEVACVTVADPGGKTLPGARKRLGRKLGATWDDPGAMLEREQPALALVSLEARLAPPAIESALKAGCHVLAEKPACVRLEDFARLADLAEGKGRHLMLALANRLKPEVIEARRLVQEGRIGKIYGVELHTIADQARLTRPAYHASWYARKERAGGGHLIWLGIHWIDLAMFITGSRIADVNAFSALAGGQPIDVEDSVALAFRMDTGALGTLTSGYYLDKGYHTHIKIWGARGWVQIDPLAGARLTWYCQDDPEPKLRRIEQFDGPTGYPPFVRACARAVAGLEPPPITTHESLRALGTVFAAYRSAETGRREKVE